MSKFNREDWIGRSFKCLTTGEEVTITKELANPGEFIIVGDGFIDLGDSYYCRWSGVVEITGENDE